MTGSHKGISLRERQWDYGELSWYEFMGVVGVLLGIIDV